MPDIFYLISKWWKQMFILVLLSLIIVGAITFLKPRQYLSVVTALPVNSALTDKGSIFNENIEALYPALGTSDELDRMVGTGQLDTIYLAVTDKFNLFDHYKIAGSSFGSRLKAARILKHYSKIYKSGHEELKIKVWDTDRNLAPQLANALFDELQSIYQHIQNSNNISILNTLRSARQKDSLQPGNLTTGNPEQIHSKRTEEYEKLINEYQLMVDARPPALIIVEKAQPALGADRPKKLNILIATFLASFIFSILLSLLLERKNTSKN